MSCKWWQQETEFPAIGNCDTPLPRLTRPERRRTNKEYPDVPNKIMCKACMPNDLIGFSLVVLIVAIPLYAATKIIK